MSHARATLAAHPRHAALAALVAGLLAGGVGTRAAGPVAAALMVAVVVAAAPLAATRASAAAAIALGVIAGALIAHERTSALSHSALGYRIGHFVSARATLLEPARRDRFGRASAPARVFGERVLLRADARLAWARAGAGAELAVRGVLRAAGPFERARRANAVLAADAVRITGQRGGVAGLVDGVRARAVTALEGGAPPAQAALLRGMVLGDDHALPAGMREDFRRSGLTHLVAASGQNVMLLAALALAAGAALGLTLRARLALVLGLVALYVPLAGAGPSIQRAGVMGAAGVLAGMIGRPASRWYALGLAAAATLALDPRSAADPGWQMSFAAVVAIFTAAPRLRRLLEQRRLPGALAEALSITAAATVATAPVIAWHFGRVSLVSIAANVLAAPAVAPVMWLGMTAAAIGQLTPALAVPPAAVASYPAAYIGWVGHVAAAMPGASVTASAGVVLAGSLALMILAWSRRARRALPLAGLACATAVAVAIAHPSARVAPPPRGVLRVTFLDVGQGDATLLQDGRAAILIDAGPPDGGVVERLRHAGVARLDALVVTHAQADHEGGAAAVLRNVPVALVVDGRDGVRTLLGERFAAEAARRGVRLITPDAGQVVRAGRLELRVLSPSREPATAHAGEDPNTRAIVALASDGDRTVLMTADAESELLAPLALGAVDVLKVSHHGSADAGLPGLLQRTHPGLAVVSVGAHNSYGHPAPATMRELRRAVGAVYRTDADGSVRVELSAGDAVVRTHA